MKSNHQVSQLLQLLLFLSDSVVSYQLHTNNDLGLESEKLTDGGIYPQYISDNPRLLNDIEYDSHKLRHLEQGNIIV